jgi:hypothetical protein
MYKYLAQVRRWSESEFEGYSEYRNRNHVAATCLSPVRICVGVGCSFASALWVFFWWFGQTIACCDGEEWFLCRGA